MCDPARHVRLRLRVLDNLVGNNIRNPAVVICLGVKVWVVDGEGEGGGILPVLVACNPSISAIPPSCYSAKGIGMLRVMWTFTVEAV